LHEIFREGVEWPCFWVKDFILFCVKLVITDEHAYWTICKLVYFLVFLQKTTTNTFSTSLLLLFQTNKTSSITTKTHNCLALDWLKLCGITLVAPSYVYSKISTWSMLTVHIVKPTVNMSPPGTSTTTLSQTIGMIIYATADEAVAYMFYRCFFACFPTVKYETTVLGNGWTDFHETFTKR